MKFFSCPLTKSVPADTTNIPSAMVAKTRNKLAGPVTEKVDILSLAAMSDRGGFFNDWIFQHLLELSI